MYRESVHNNTFIRFNGSVSLGGGQDSENMTAAVRDLYSTMDKGTTIPPIIMLQVLKVNSKQP